jgi:hypothetical protein
MLPTSHVPIPVPEPLALLDATLLFVIQVLIAQHPALLAAPEDSTPPPAYPLRAARHVLLAVREVHYALDSYRAMLADKPGLLGRVDAEDEIQF